VLDPVAQPGAVVTVGRRLRLGVWAAWVAGVAIAVPLRVADIGFELGHKAARGPVKAQEEGSAVI